MAAPLWISGGWLTPEIAGCYHPLGDPLLFKEAFHRLFSLHRPLKTDTAHQAQTSSKDNNPEMNIKPFFLFVIILSLFSISGCKPSPASLMTAVKADNTEEAVTLIKKGADANSRTTPNGWSALHYAARNGNVEVVHQLLNAGADPNYAGSMNGQANSTAALKPVSLAQGMLDVILQIPASQMEATLRQNGLDDPALLKSTKDPKAADRYREVVNLLTK